MRHAPGRRRPSSDGTRRRCGRACRRAPSRAACAAPCRAPSSSPVRACSRSRNSSSRRPRKLRRVAEAAVARDRTPRGTASTVASSASAPGTVHGRRRAAPSHCSCAVSASADCATLPRSSLPDARDLAAGCRRSPGRPHLRRRRKVGAAVERLQLRRQPDAHRPAARSGRRLHERHVDAIDVGPLLAIDLDRHEVLVEHARRPPSFSNDSCSITWHQWQVE